jgi:hypothetical protein
MGSVLVQRETLGVGEVAEEDGQGWRQAGI